MRATIEILPWKPGAMGSGFDIHIVRTEYGVGSHIQSYVTNMTMEELKEGTEPPPVCRIEDDAAQLLMDRLWRFGIRPSCRVQADEIAAVKAHLADMRKLVALSVCGHIGDLDNQ